ncbi:Hypothetical protein NTJ_05837 [Nesidiocoris tenuis]|uniref:Uncharacterized protein n=1 Tax=Nesidiocoris tenuis TaxID=355587 RepID=A0ABN7ALC8_9HEMI|nr:Hypothetical protein NTJ_05837 [Nesidiocoris tenuis]
MDRSVDYRVGRSRNTQTKVGLQFSPRARNTTERPRGHSFVTSLYCLLGENGEVICAVRHLRRIEYPSGRSMLSLAQLRSTGVTANFWRPNSVGSLHCLSDRSESVVCKSR